MTHQTYIGDLHIHSRFSRATSRDGDPEHLEFMARKKGIHILGTGDFTHPTWRAELMEKLEPAEDGLYVLKEEYRIHQEGVPEEKPRFLVTGEISSIYKKNERVRKVHSLLLLPGLEEAEALSRRLELIGNIHSDGRPILGLDCRDLLEIMLETCPEAVYVPAHIWTPHFSLFGAFSGFDSIEECFGDLTPYIHALETGLSSDPPMNWRVSALDSYFLVSNSDAHSPAKLGREATLFQTELSYAGIAKAINTGEGLAGTLEFFPEEGKYHFDGHRKCGLCISPQETAEFGGRCPVCGKKITIGVLNRVEQLADRPEDYVRPDAKPFESLVPLPEVIAASTGASAAGKKVQETCDRMVGALGPEFFILRQAPIEDIRHAAGPLVAEGISRLREGRVKRTPGYDGEYGKIGLLSEEDISSLEGQLSLFSAEELEQMEQKEERTAGAKRRSGTKRTEQEGKDAEKWGAETAEKTAAEEFSRELGAESAEAVEKLLKQAEELSVSAPESRTSASASEREKEILSSLNPLQEEAVRASDRAVAVIAGPGAGKTKTLIARLQYLVEVRGVAPGQITAVTFTNRAAQEMRDRLKQASDAKQCGYEDIQIGTFHAVSSRFLKKKGIPVLLADEGLKEELAGEAMKQAGLKGSPGRFLRDLSRVKNGMTEPESEEGKETEEDKRMEARRLYQEAMKEQGVMDYDDLLLETLRLLEEEETVAEEDRACFSCLLIDEFQDINPLQYRLMQAWNRNGTELFVIGDPDQSIYGFRGSDAACFDKLQADFPELHTIRLEENYRSTRQILAASLAVISHNEGGARQMRAHRDGVAAVRIVTAPDERREAIFTAKEINRQIGGIDMLDTEENEHRGDAARSFSDIAVLYRTHRQAAWLEKCLRQEGIPYVVAGREDFLMRREVRAALAFFRYALYPEQEGAGELARRLLCPLLGEAAEERFEYLISKYGKKIKRTKPVRLLEEWMQEWEPEGEDADAVMEDLNRLADMAVLYPTMEAFLDTLDFGEDGDVRRNGGRKFRADAVTLMTLHGSKGLEFPVVILYGMEADKMPLQTGLVRADLQEERRLCFVGMTRAVEELILTCAEQPSPFLAEIPQDMAVRENAVEEKPEAQMEAEQLSLFDFM
ncbi:MAG TPA: UvrD-helicase domain-containing protein [Candidatus Eisenbergiella merdipullorum]|uniref:DNA 3'-5' helicase n=1 Tax=Candidatus Eisenbergiella merdipullorum TaxID=2838553 RepID=A0A9D2I6P1_9FIRM|nr:UvrD-helicase domain-containing protein [Candidatus Eisenbergiella merdipullorum]